MKCHQNDAIKERERESAYVPTPCLVQCKREGLCLTLVLQGQCNPIHFNCECRNSLFTIFFDFDYVTSCMMQFHHMSIILHTTPCTHDSFSHEKRFKLLSMTHTLPSADLLAYARRSAPSGRVFCERINLYLK